MMIITTVVSTPLANLLGTISALEVNQTASEFLIM